VDAEKTLRQDATVEELAELSLDKAGNNAIPFALPGQKGFQISGDHSMERVVFRIARPVSHLDSHEGIA